VERARALGVELTVDELPAELVDDLSIDRYSTGP
jgi:hypothetical protein